MSNTTQTIVQGPAGNLEVMLSEPSGNIDGVAVLCHPHPLYGGSMHDSVLNIATSALLQQHIAVARFNFRVLAKVKESAAEALSKKITAILRAARGRRSTGCSPNGPRRISRYLA